MPPFQRVQRSKTSCVKTDSVDSVVFVFSCFFFVCFFVGKFALLANMCSVTELCMLPSLVHVLTVWDVANGKRGLKGVVFCLGVARPFFCPHLRRELHLLTTTALRRLIPHVVGAPACGLRCLALKVLRRGCIRLSSFTSSDLHFLFSSTFFSTLSQRVWR